MSVDVPAEMYERCKEVGDGAAYAVRVLCGQLDDNPLLGSRQAEPSLYVTRIDGDAFENCPDLDVYYAYGPPALGEGQVQIRRIEPVTPSGGGERGELPAASSGAGELRARQVTVAWQRIEAWLRDHAPASHSSLKPGAPEEEIVALERVLGVPVPVELKALWRLCAGAEKGRAGAAFLLGDWVPMGLDSVAEVHRSQMSLQLRHEQETRAQQRERRDRGADGGFVHWNPAWIPFCSLGVEDFGYGLYVDGRTGAVCEWTEFADHHEPEYASLTVYLEEMADALETPALACTRPGLVDGAALSWGRLAPGQKALWEPLNG
ncbi:SMI1/KNR4 family protein [Streptomyces cacaoi]|uniref:SMI1/KNR4 family protein n=1 Tax=Streptomyces cacaoi TaxID=1898 RepID=UPI0037484288